MEHEVVYILYDILVPIRVYVMNTIMEYSPDSIRTQNGRETRKLVVWSYP